jgi:hypothetical protein
LLGLISACLALQAHAPELLKVSPTSASIAGGTQLTLTMASIDPNSVLADVTVVFQQTISSKCQLLKFNTDQEQWDCVVVVPGNAGLVASSNIDPSGIAIYTAQQGRAKMATSGFTFFDSGVPRLVDRYPDPSSGPTSGSDTRVKFSNYCAEHLASEYAVTFRIGDLSVSSTVRSRTYVSESCTTTLNLQVPSMDSGGDSVVTVIPNGQTDKALDFSFTFVETLSVTTSLSKAIVDSQFEIAFTLSNLEAISNQQLCEGSSCANDHNLKISFGQVCCTHIALRRVWLNH